jgi:hypothetical protein
VTVVRTTTETTLVEALVRRLRAAASAAGDAAPPVAVLWPDPESEWARVASLLLDTLPELLILGDYAPKRRTGPAIWLRCLIERTLSDPALPADRPPILWLPGVGRQHLRAGEDCPRALQPLVELMHRGTLWLQKGGHDWTVPAFLTSAQGLGLDMARDDATRAALERALSELAVAPLAQLRDRRLEAEDFDRLLSRDPVRDLLRWIGDPVGARERMGDNGWGAFVSQTRERLGFDPSREPDVRAGELLGRGEGAWEEVWQRYTESPSAFPGIEALLRRSRPGGLLALERERWPDLNDGAEVELRQALDGLPGRTHADACRIVAQLETQHAPRRDWVWARLGQSPLAGVLDHLARLATAASQALGGATPAEVAEVYRERGWQGDAAGWEAVALAPPAEEARVSAAVRHLLLPWLARSGETFQAAVGKHGLPRAGEQERVEAGEDGCVLFSDGLRYDLGVRLAERLEGRGLRVRLGHRFALLPTVTATAKPAVSPVADLVRGEALREDFGAVLLPAGKPADAKNLREALRERGYQILGDGEFDPPQQADAKGWLEFGDIDELGHKVGARLARHLGEELDRHCERIASLLDSGWKRVRVVTDHGWLMLPGGLPRVDLPKHLTASRWARCAVISGNAAPDVLRHPWSWNPHESFAYAAGIACFNKTEEYAHGGLSIQECLTPDLVVERAGDRAPRVEVATVTWRGLRCFAVVRGAGASLRADLRLGGPGGDSVAAAVKTVDPDGAVSLVLRGDEHENSALVLVLLDEGGQILAQRPTRVGEST